jgi:hypothetical protein
MLLQLCRRCVTDLGADGNQYGIKKDEEENRSRSPRAKMPSTRCTFTSAATVSENMRIRLIEHERYTAVYYTPLAVPWVSPSSAILMQALTAEDYGRQRLVDMQDEGQRYDVEPAGWETAGRETALGC